jgi:hypothetical protein
LARQSAKNKQIGLNLRWDIQIQKTRKLGQDRDGTKNRSDHGTLDKYDQVKIIGIELVKNFRSMEQQKFNGGNSD